MIIKQIKKVFESAKVRNWDKLYFFYDLHETILIPDYDNLQPLRFYPYAKEALQLMSRHPLLVNIIYTCSYPEEIERYLEFFESHDIYFKYVNDNPEVENTRLGDFSQKKYFNVLFEDKAGFDAETEWRDIYYYFAELENPGQTIIDIDFKFLYPSSDTPLNTKEYADAQWAKANGKYDEYLIDRGLKSKNETAQLQFEDSAIKIMAHSTYGRFGENLEDEGLRFKFFNELKKKGMNIILKNKKLYMKYLRTI